MHPVSPENVLWPLFELAERDPDRILLTFVDDAGRDAETRTARELVARIVDLAHYLTEDCGLKKGEVALLVYPPSMEFIDAFAACLFAGIIAAPVYPPQLARPDSDLEKLRTIAERSGAKAILTNRVYRWAVRASTAKGVFLKGSAPKWPALPWFVTQGVARSRTVTPSVEFSRKEVAVLQFTSGSTSTPKGVRLTHENLIHQLDFNRKVLDMNLESRFVMWVPQYHDLGLISGILSALRGNGALWFMSPMSFLKRPELWFEVMHRVRGTHSASPNFGYELIVKKTTESLRSKWDLSCVKILMSAAEPIVPGTVDRFFKAFECTGLSPRVFCPAYGLAEHTVGVTVGGRQRIRIERKALAEKQQAVPDSSPEALELIGCGSPREDIEVRIVREKGEGSVSAVSLPAGQVGEIWVRSGSVADGYEGLPELSREVFQAAIQGEQGVWFKTGDLGFLYDGELFISGRKKDLIILRGKNFYPEDIEESVRNAHPSIRAGGVVAFSVPGEATEQMVVLVEEGQKGFVSEILQAVRKKVFELWQVHAVVGLLPPKSLKKTTSGKIRRSACRQAWLEGAFEVIEVLQPREQTAVIESATGNIGETLGIQLGEVSEEDRVEVLVATIRKLIQSQSKESIDHIGLDDYLPDSGLDSITSAEILIQLEESLNRSLPSALFVEHPTLRSAARRILSEMGLETTEQSPAVVEEQECMTFRPEPHRRLSPAKTRIGIIGGGVGGLVSAFELARLGYKNITLFESNSFFGGKVLTVPSAEGGNIELGANFFLDSFQTILELAREVGCEVLPRRQDLQMWDEEFGFEDGPARSPGRKWASQVVRAARLSLNPTLPFPSMSGEDGRLAVSFESFLKEHKLWPAHPMFYFDWNGMGYGLDLSAPALHVISYLQVIAAGAHVCFLKEGNQSLWIKMAQQLKNEWGVSFLNSKDITDLLPDESGVTVKSNDQEYRFDEVISAIPPRTLAKVLPQSDPLQRVLTRFESLAYSVLSFRAKGLPEDAVFFPKFSSMLGKPILIGPVYESREGWYMSGQISAAHAQSFEPLSLEVLRKELKDVITQMGGELLAFGPEKTWEYFPHTYADPAATQRSAEALQGSRHLWTTGSWISFETTEHVARHARHLVRTCFDPVSRSNVISTGA